MAVGYLRTSAGLIVTNNTIQASHFNNEFNLLQSAFNAITGHNHDGTAGGGAPLAGSAFADGAITYAKIQNVSANTMLGRGTGAGVVTEFPFTAFARTLVDDADAATMRATLGITAYNQAAVAITGGTITGVTISGLASTLAIADGGTGSANAAAARTNLGLGTIATQASSAVSITGGTITGTSITTSSATITGGSITGITDLAIADGGTGASTAGTARTALGTGGLADVNTWTAANAFSDELDIQSRVKVSQVTTTSTSYAVPTTTVYVLLTGTAARAVTLPAAASQTRRYIYVKDAAGTAATGNITVSISGGGNIDGATTYVINTNYGAAAFICNGTQWYLV